MIVKVTEDNIKLYKDLFQKASATLRENGKAVEINDIEGYFQHLEDLMNESLQYTMLPVDEEKFVIDANTRAIKVPTNFTKNGIGVQGDDVAEIVWFEIDRYYDIIDFYNTRPVVQWKHSGETESYISDAWFVDINTKPDKLIFGWPLEKAICEKSGDLEFSVRFISFEGSSDNLNYSFNTLPTKVKINKSLNISEITNIIDDSVNEKIKSRIKNSVDGNVSFPHPPIFITAANSGYSDVVNNKTFLLVDAKNPSTPKKVNIGNAGSSLFLTTGAVSTTNINYSWKQEISAGEIINLPSADMDEIQTIYLPVIKENNNYKINDVDKNLICYSDSVATKLINFEDKESYQGEIVVEEIKDASGKSLGSFAKAYVSPSDFSTCEIDSPGIYWVVVSNDVANADKYPTLCTIKSKKVIVPEPEPLEFIGYTENGGVKSFLQIPKNSTETYIVKGYFNEPEFKDVVYSWNYKKNIHSNIEEIDNATIAELSFNKDTVTGFYSINAINKYNNGEANLEIPEDKDINFFVSHEPELNFYFDENFKTNRKVHLSIDIGAKDNLDKAFYGKSISIASFEKIDEISSATQKDAKTVDLDKLPIEKTEYKYDNNTLVITFDLSNVFSDKAIGAVVRTTFFSKLNDTYQLEISTTNL